MKHMETHFGKNEPGKVGVGQEEKIICLTKLHQKQGFLFNITYILNGLFHIYKTAYIPYRP